MVIHSEDDHGPDMGQDQVKLGALVTAAGAVITIWLAWVCTVGRFTPRAEKSAAA